MKFTDGQWLLQPGVAAHYATQAYAVDIHDDRLVVLVTTRHIKHRGDTLQGPTLTLTISSPLPGAVRVQVEHYAASQPPRLHVPMPGAGATRVTIEDSDVSDGQREDVDHLIHMRPHQMSTDDEVGFIVD